MEEDTIIDNLLIFIFMLCVGIILRCILHYLGIYPMYISPEEIYLNFSI